MDVERGGTCNHMVKNNKPVRTVAVPKSADFEERQSTEFKPKPLPTGSTMSSAIAAIRARHARATQDEAVAFARTHAPSHS